MDKDWLECVARGLGQPVADITPLGGGDFAESFRAALGDGLTVFIKTHRNPPNAFFSTEATGLRWLSDSEEVSVPQVLAVSDNPPYLVMEWVESGAPNHSTEAALGRMLARLHRKEQLQFGRPDNCLTGSLGLENRLCATWAEFYASCRLLPLSQIARDRQALPVQVISSIQKIANRLDQLDVPVESASLLHGDLWAGNRLVDQSGKSWLIDPAAHHGHREFDLAMMQLFGGFEPPCLAAYHEVYPLEPGWEYRVKLHQLAPLIVHAIKFGGGYVSAVEDVVRTYS